MENIDQKIAEIISQPEMQAYQTQFPEGGVLFYENDESRDLYILVSGELEIWKGNVRVGRISQSGQMFGEMSYLLDQKRSATVKARTDAGVLKVPDDRIQDIMGKYPQLAFANSVFLARSLRDTTCAFYGFKEFSDHLPDAVYVTDKAGRVVSWNQAAEKQSGLTWDQMRSTSATDLFQEMESQQRLIDDIQAGPSETERTYTLKHPIHGTRYVASKANVLLDELGNATGVLLLCRDVTLTTLAHKKTRRLLYGVCAALVVLALAAGAALYLYPAVLDSTKALTEPQRNLMAAIVQDKAQLLEALDKSSNTHEASEILQEFFLSKKAGRGGYRGAGILDKDKVVVAAWVPDWEKGGAELLGHNFSGINFLEVEDSTHSVLVTYRITPDHPTGKKGLALAFRLEGKGPDISWLLLQMDPGILQDVFDADEATLQRFEIP